ncbi:MAG: AraC family transcriptional regulator [Spirochaetes bacterium]|nr:AraC family transcriptional regulator [Spirochaetota bacterium]
MPSPLVRNTLARLIDTLTAPELSIIDAAKPQRAEKREIIPNEYEHAHEKTFEFIYVDAGSLILTCNGRPVRFTAPCLIIMPPGVRHHERPLKNGAAYRALWIAMHEHTDIWVSHRDARLPYPRYKTAAHLKAPISLDNYLIDYRDLFSNDRYTMLYQRNRFINYCIAVHRHLGAAEETESPTGEVTYLMKTAMQDATRFIEENYTRAISVSDVAANAGYSSDHFSRMYRKIYGISPLALISKLRLERAKKQLTASSLRITEIARDAGYANLTYFIAVFKKTYGVSPSAYRERKVL